MELLWFRSRTSEPLVLFNFSRAMLILLKFRNHLVLTNLGKFFLNLYIYIYIYIYIYKWSVTSTESSVKRTILQTCVYATPSFMLWQCSGIVGIALFSCYVKASKENTKYEQYTILIHNIIYFANHIPRALIVYLIRCLHEGNW